VTTQPLTRYELEVMEILWDRGSASVRDVHEALQESRRPAYTTIATIVSRLEEKGVVRRSDRVGNALVFEPLLTRRASLRRLVDDFLDIFQGSPQPLLQHLVESGKVSLADLQALEQAAREAEHTDEETTP
jgi:predicted transcriptional regulator